MTWFDLVKDASDDMCCANARAATLSMLNDYASDVIRTLDQKDRAEATTTSADTLRMVEELDCVADRGLNAFLMEMAKVPNSEWFKDESWAKLQPLAVTILQVWIKCKEDWE
tara:strand:+ start:4127 stop:4462 length:336 start_codon:yes stop_codon:yes gene_type:complete